MSLPADLVDLLETARELFRARLQPAVPAELRFEAAMIANAMAIVARAAAGRVPGAAETEGLRRLYPEAADAPVETLRRRLVADIRAGRMDAAGSRLAAYVLRPRVSERLALSDPEYRTGL
ncbi:MAG: DUF6285 domain-containing protein [Geminicoccaceae bacterium]|nr:DUF6285 domain-containing protein [Geminicoccaceae bacterium]MCX7630766.1 DUF6285 domain-containing protein [Geminicoccaceae bacterium]MDW8124403.1 DUF6285 domain-containing protein [Geminicoccaceae bacterium]MDW8340825.1 DUF6285 domain-containing protein [Geminicoccaceae bacterium]